MAQVRYLGFVVGDGALDAASEPSALGHFVSISEPLPVGTLVEVDGASHQVTRVEEGASPGCWILPAGAARPAAVRPVAAPVAVDAEATTRSEPPTIEMVADSADDEPPTPSASAPAREDGAPEPTGDEGSRGTKRKRRPKKTVLGR